MSTKLFAIAFCAAALMGVSATGALAGEVKGPPTGGDSEHEVRQQDPTTPTRPASSLV